MLRRDQWRALSGLQEVISDLVADSKHIDISEKSMKVLEEASDKVSELFPVEKEHADLVVDPLIEALPKPTWPFEWVDLDDVKETLAHAEAPGYIPAGIKSQRKIMEELVPAMLVELAYLRKVAFAARNYLDEDMEPKTTTGYRDWQNRLWQLLEYGEEDNGG